MFMAHGTTSAYAENTTRAPPPQGPPGNYLRVRGEYRTTYCNTHHTMELPPRTRRIRGLCGGMVLLMGTTSAYAENTADHQWAGIESWNYLRVRGEYINGSSVAWLMKELPPRTRRIPNPDALSNLLVGTTSAYAENTAPSRPRRR